MNRSVDSAPGVNPLLKAVRASDRRITRFHDERGRLMPINAWARLPAAVWARISGGARDKPWMVPAAVSYLGRLIRPSWSVFEFGSGWSTLWYAKRAKAVISLEHDPGWHSAVANRLFQTGVENVDLRLVTLRMFPKTIESFGPASFDLVIVDGMEEMPGDRLACVKAATSRVRTGGYIVLDDSDGAPYRGADRLLTGWVVKRFVGLKHFPLMAIETSVYRRPSAKTSDPEDAAGEP